MSERFRRVLASRWFDPALATLLTGVCLAELFARPELTNSLRAPFAVIILGATVAVRRAHPVAAACVQASVFLATPNFDNNFLPDSGQMVVLVVAYSCGAHVTGRTGLAAVGALAICMQVGMGFSEFPNFEVYFGTLVPWWVGLQVGRRRRLVSELAERTTQLEAEQDAFARLAVRRERARIARELHDIVGHHLAVMVVQAGAGRVAATGHSERDAQRFESIRESGSQVLAEMSRLVDILHADSGGVANGHDRFRLLIGQASEAGLDVHITPLPVHVSLPPEVEDSAFRVVQEGLTNAMKHAPGAAVEVGLAVHDHELDIEVRDAGAAVASFLAGTGSGLGLDGMRERIESIGGALEAGPQAGGGWCLTARLPVDVPSPVPPAA
jgi:signal transduction histidine kinase